MILQFDIPPEVLALVRVPDEVRQTHERTLQRYWVTKLGWMHLTPYKGLDAVMFFACSAQCAGSCCAPGARTLAQIREMFCYEPWRERHGMEPTDEPKTANRAADDFAAIRRAMNAFREGD